MPLIDSPYDPYITEFLETLKPNCLSSLASKVSKGKLPTNTRTEYIKQILRKTDDLPEFFSYREITKAALIKYLDKKIKSDNKEALIRKVKQLWNVSPEVRPEVRPNNEMARELQDIEREIEEINRKMESHEEKCKQIEDKSENERKELKEELDNMKEQLKKFSEKMDEMDRHKYK